MSFWQNKVVLVTGGSSGLGRVIAEAFAAAGAKIVVAALEADAVRQAADEMQSAGRDVLGIHADITRQEDVDRLFAEAIERFGRLDVLVNNAGRSMRGKVLDTTPEQFRDLMELNLIALVRCTRAAVPAPAARSAGTWSTSARWRRSRPPAGWAPIRPRSSPWPPIRSSCGWSWARKGLHVLLVCPGPIERKDARLYPLDGLEDVPEAARRPGAGVKVRATPPQDLARRILRACERRQAGVGRARQGPAACSPSLSFGRAWAIGSCCGRRASKGQ